MKRYTLKAVGSAAAAALTLTACGGGGDAEPQAEAPASADPNAPETLTFTWWGSDDRATRAAGRSLPDVMQFDLSYLREHTENGHLLDLTHLIGEQIDTGEIDESLLESGQLEGEQVGIPTSTNTLGLIYHPTLLEQTGVEPPSEDYTWEEYNEFLAEVSEAGQSTPEGQPIFGGADYTNTFWFFLQWLVQQGKTPFTDDGEFGFEEGSVDARVVAYEESVADHVTESVPVPAKGFGSIEAEYKRLAEELAHGTIDIDGFVESWFSEAAIMTQ